VVIGLRMGRPFPLHFQWFQHSMPFGQRVKLDLRPGDLYAMCSKAAGTDWKTQKTPTLRHAAGCQSFLRIAQEPALSPDELSERKRERQCKRNEERQAKRARLGP
jgi:hypothetical protein